MLSTLANSQQAAPPGLNLQAQQCLVDGGGAIDKASRKRLRQCPDANSGKKHLALEL